MKRSYLVLLIIFSVLMVEAQPVTVNKDHSGFRLMVENEPFMINGMNWDYFPIGTNYSYDLWSQPERTIKEALDQEMSLLREMGVNAIRVYTGIPARWIEYIYRNYGIYTMLNHSFGRYGLTLEGEWEAQTDYSEPRVREILLEEVTEMVEQHKDTPGLLFFLLGNENNYGLFWEGAETEDIPLEDEGSPERVQALYSLFNEAAIAMKNVDAGHPIALCNGDLLFLDVIKEECTDIDIFGTNIYRGVSFGDAFEKVEEELDKPVIFTEFGADAYDVIKDAEDQASQAYYLIGNWLEIYENAAGLGKAGNSLGGFTFQFSDGWWKSGQDYNLEIHDTNASWSNGGYITDYTEGSNNMNEEWFGICAKGQTNSDGLYLLEPRMAYYALTEVHKFRPYSKRASKKKLFRHFRRIRLDDMAGAGGDKGSMSDGINSPAKDTEIDNQ